MRPFEAQRVGTFEYDVATRRLSWSAGLAAIFGQRPEEGVGHADAFVQCIRAEDRSRALECLALLLAGAAEAEDELRTQGSSGAVPRIHVRCRSRLGADGRVNRLTGTVAESISLAEVERAEGARSESNRRAEALLTASGTIVVGLAANGECRSAASAWFEFTGQSQDEQAGMGWLAAFHPGDREPIGRVLQATIDEQRPGALDCRLWCARSSAWRAVRVRAAPVLDLHGAVEECAVGIETVLELPRDVVTERDSEARLRLVLRATNDIVWDWDLSTGMIEWSERYCADFGFPPGDLRMPFDECDRRVHPDDREELDRSLTIALEGADEFWKHEYRYRTAHEDWRIVHDRGYIVRDAHGKAVRMIGALQDITSRRSAEQALARNELHYRGIVDTVKAILWQADPATLRFEFVSREAERLGYPLDAWLRPGFWIDNIQPEDRDTTLHACTSETAAGRDHEFEYRFRAADGRWVWLRDVRRVVVEGQRVTQLVGLLYDVTELKEAQLALQASEARFRALYEQAGVGMAHSALDGKLVDANPAFCALLGYSRDELIGMSLASISDPRDMVVNLALREDVLSGRRTHLEMDKRYLRKDGTTLHARLVAGVVRARDGTPECFLGIVQDIGERLRAEHAIREANATLEQRVQDRTHELQAALRELESFSHSVSHDLRAPLRATDGFSRLLLEEHAHQLNDEGQAWLHRIRANCASMSQSIDGLATLARLSRGELNLARIDLGVIAREIVAGLCGQDPDRDVEFETRGELSTSADPRLARILLENLLGNAWKFTSSRPRAKIELFEERSARGGRAFALRDDGVGFEPELAGRLFKPFERLHSTTEFPGSGIGLATVQRIVHRHGGDVWIEGVPDRGACVHFTLGGS